VPYPEGASGFAFFEMAQGTLLPRFEAQRLLCASALSTESHLVAALATFVLSLNPIHSDAAPSPHELS